MRSPIVWRIAWCLAWLAIVLIVSAFGACIAGRTDTRDGYVVPWEDDASIPAGPQPLAADSTRVERTPRSKVGVA